MLKSLFAKAMKGETRASSALISLIIGLEANAAQKNDPSALNDDDLAIIEAFKQRVLRDAKTSDEESS